MKKSADIKLYTKVTSLLLIFFVIMYVLSLKNYLIPHTIMELIGAVVAMTIFSIGWNTRHYTKNNFMTILAVGYLVVGILTILHALSFPGMGIFPGCGFNMATQFWIATRYIESITILVATFFLKKRNEVNSSRLLYVYLFICSIIITSIFINIFPDCFIEGSGLTTFKVVSEYIICIILLISGILLWKQRSKFEGNILSKILAAIAFTILSELSFTLYTDPYGFLNLLGHFFMIVSILLLYNSLILDNLTRPYETLFRNVTEYAKELADTSKESEIKDKAIASSLNAIILTDLEGSITYVNESTLNLLGYEAKEVIGRLAKDFIDDTYKKEIDKDKIFAEGSWYGEILLKKNDGSLMHGLLTTNLIYSKQGEPICGMASFLDITSRKKMEEELIKAKNDAEAANIAKSNFLANMSHEIRTPMNGILGFLQLLEKTSISNKQLEYINYIKASSDTLLAVINDILDVSKIEAGKMELESIPFDLHLAVESAVMPFTAKAEEKGLDINMLIKPEVPKVVTGDPIRLRQILSNLIGNAIKFTHMGYVFLEVGIDVIEESNVILQFMIEDTGIGISQESIEKLFQPFTQAEASSNRRFGGSGLGLTICKSFINMMGGDIRVESVEGRGTKFFFTISLEVDTNTRFGYDEDYSVLKGKRLMVVDDLTINNNIVKIYLQEAGCMVTEVDNIIDALSKLLMHKKSAYHGVLIDLKILFGDGDNMIELLKDISKDMPFILMTPVASNVEEYDDIINMNISGYLTKPCKRNELLQSVAKVLS